MAPFLSNSGDGGKQIRRLLRNPRRHRVNNAAPTRQPMSEAMMMQHLGLIRNENQARPVVAQPGQQVPPGGMLLYQLLQTLRARTTSEQHQQVLQTLRSNPQLMTAYIRHRQHQLQIQQQQAGSQNVDQPRPGQHMMPASGLNSQQHQTNIIQDQGQQNMGMDGQILMPQQQVISQQSSGSSDAQGQQQH